MSLNDDLSASQPNFIEGLQLREFEPFPVEKHIDGAILFEGNPDSITLPHRYSWGIESGWTRRHGTSEAAQRPRRSGSCLCEESRPFIYRVLRG
ncbi:hypothetical protein B0T19DRAFT_413304 [Cercophora scortea]|uniref:Uncharacterized protein n=1 Tax=Cercophora scortea TaxID=314031 RepID=A0AAE0J703_9PEZI|nr:hypothetical protein B0T19DRAFT_413304 [Cercophora scortea]